MSAILQAIQGIAPQVVQGVAQLMAGNQQNRPVAPAPVGNAEPKAANAVEFKEVAPVATTGAPTAAQFNELVERFNKLGTQFAAQGATLADMKKVLDSVAPWVFAAQESEDVSAVFAEVNATGVVKAEQEKLRKGGYGDSQIQLATNTVTNRIAPAVVKAIRETSVNFSEAGSQLSKRVPQLFAEVVAEWKAANVVPSGIASTSQTRPADADGVAPASFAQPNGAPVVVPAKVTDADVKQLIAFAPQHAHLFDANNGRVESMKDLGVLFAEFEGADAQSKARFRNSRIAYAAARLNDSVNF